MSSPLGFFKSLYEYDHVMNMTQLKMLKQAGWPEEGVKLLSHISNASMTWIQRLQGQAGMTEIWTEYDADTLERRLNELNSLWLNYLDSLSDAAIEDEVSYANTKGVPFRNKIEDILFHVINHGTHHRGQISTLLRQGGTTPVLLDYIMYVREKQS